MCIIIHKFHREKGIGLWSWQDSHYESVLIPTESACGQIILICIAILHQRSVKLFSSTSLMAYKLITQIFPCFKWKRKPKKNQEDRKKEHIVPPKKSIFSIRRKHPSCDIDRIHRRECGFSSFFNQETYGRRTIPQDSHFSEELLPWLLPCFPLDDNLLTQRCNAHLSLPLSFLFSLQKWIN